MFVFFCVVFLLLLFGGGCLLVNKFKNVNGFTRISGIKRVFHSSVVSEVSFSAGVLQTSGHCRTAAGQLFGY